ncbi:V0D/AC39 family V-type ATPase subunit [Desulfurobacterium atlanticum]|uniref:V/A-type H+-transporting ATPase subunit C n=1 Tax=Desulfurobacterium atlanticum TaxID=240169 RepID=A0A238XU55_9BACT|nr:V-type ATPase subunit [Desulfurobacterium atlanticum]SNR61539.1 V/A-type H+-transporting ATPase subunit C [Desulfurobacterium atlanticum]
MWIAKPVRFSYVNAMCRTIKSTLLDFSVFEKLISATTVGDIIIVIKDTPYGKFVRSVLQDSIEKGLDLYFTYLYEKVTEKLSKNEQAVFSLFFIERKLLKEKKKKLQNRKNAKELFKKLDTQYIKQLKQAILKLDRIDRRDLKTIAGSYFDLINILTVVRLKFIYNFKTDEIRSFIIPFGNFLSQEKAEKILKTDKLSEISLIVPEIFRKPITDFTDMRNQLYNYHISVLKKVWLGYPFKLSVPFALLRLKEIEIKNLKACIEGIRLGLPEQEIKRMLVGV